MDHIDVRSYHCPPPAESTYSTKSTADLDPARQRYNNHIIQFYFRPRLIDSIINRKNSSSPYRPTTSTIKKENARFFVPNLYANQRVRQRSISRESPPPQLKKEKKAVAFGTTITIKDRRNTSLTRPSTSFINDQSNARLELQNLRLRVEANEKMRKDVDQLQRIVKSLIEENVTLAADLRQLSKIVHELHENNSFLKTKMSLLEPWHTKDDYGDAHRTRRINGHIKRTNR